MLPRGVGLIKIRYSIIYKRKREALPSKDWQHMAPSSPHKHPTYDDDTFT